MRSFRAVLVVAAVVIAGCANNPGMPKYRTSQPAPLTQVGPARPASSVAVKMKALPWWTVFDNEHFVLRFDVQDDAPIRGRRVGPIRSRDIDLDDSVFESIRCAWSGDTNLCGAYQSVRSAGEQAHDAIAEARAELRARTADAGADVVASVRCFAERQKRADPAEHGPAKMWCEGVAYSATPDAIGVFADVDPAVPRDDEVPMPQARFTLVADAGVGIQGGKPIVSSTLGIRYRPFELGFYILDLQRESVAPQDDGLVGLGLTVLGRKQLRRHSGGDAIVGGSAIAAFQNGATNPDFDGLYQAFAGLAYQSRWNIFHGQPWVQVRAGAASGTALKNKIAPLLELHLGLATPERR